MKFDDELESIAARARAPLPWRLDWRGPVGQQRAFLVDHDGADVAELFGDADAFCYELEDMHGDRRVLVDTVRMAYSAIETMEESLQRLRGNR